MLRKQDIPIDIKGYEVLEYYDEVMGWFPYQSKQLNDPSFNPKNIRLRRRSKEENRFYTLVKTKQFCEKMLRKVRDEISKLIEIHGNGVLTTTNPKFPTPNDKIMKKYLYLCKASKRYKDKNEKINDEMNKYFNIMIKQKEIIDKEDEQFIQI